MLNLQFFPNLFTNKTEVEPVPEIKEPPPQIQPDPVPQYPVIPEPVLIPQQDPGPYGGFQPITGDNTETSEPPLKKQKKKKVLRTAAGMVWEDESLTDWDPSELNLNKNLKINLKNIFIYFHTKIQYTVVPKLLNFY